MGDIMQIDPDDLYFPPPLDRVITNLLCLKNLSASQHLAYKIKTTAPKRYCVRPNTGTLSPSTSIDVEVLLNVMKDRPRDYKTKDKFLVQWTVLSGEEEAADIQGNPKQLWAENPDQRTIFSKKLKCHFSSPFPQSQSVPSVVVSTLAEKERAGTDSSAPFSPADGSAGQAVGPASGAAASSELSPEATGEESKGVGGAMISESSQDQVDSSAAFSGDATSSGGSASGKHTESGAHGDASVTSSVPSSSGPASVVPDISLGPAENIARLTIELLQLRAERDDLKKSLDKFDQQSRWSAALSRKGGGGGDADSSAQSQSTEQVVSGTTKSPESSGGISVFQVLMLLIACLISFLLGRLTQEHQQV